MDLYSRISGQLRRLLETTGLERVAKDVTPRWPILSSRAANQGTTMKITVFNVMPPRRATSPKRASLDQISAKPTAIPKAARALPAADTRPDRRPRVAHAVETHNSLQPQLAEMNRRGREFWKSRLRQGNTLISNETEIARAHLRALQKAARSCAEGYRPN